MTELLKFEVDVKNMTEEGRGEVGGGGPARVWGSDYQNLENHPFDITSPVYFVFVFVTVQHCSFQSINENQCFA